VVFLCSVGMFLSWIVHSTVLVIFTLPCINSQGMMVLLYVVRTLLISGVVFILTTLFFVGGPMPSSGELSIKQKRNKSGLAGSHYFEFINSISLTSFFYTLAASLYSLIIVRHLRGSLGMEGCSLYVYQKVLLLAVGHCL
jgi:hypothetical protein